MGTWEEEWLDMTNDKQGMMASSPQKIESWQQEFLDTTKDMQGSVIDYTKPGAMSNGSVPNYNFTGLNEDWSVPIPGLGPIPVKPTPPVTWNPTGGGESYLIAGSGSTSTKKPAVKIATPQYVTFKNDEVNTEDADFLKMIYFEEINGAMLLSLTNNAKLSTESVNYQPIINMAEIQKALDPKNILALQDTSDKYFLNFAIKLNAKVPNVGNGPSGKNVYIDTSTGNLVIESINLNPGEKIEIETLQNGTIYETDLGVDQE